MVSKPLRGTSRPTVTMRGRAPRAATGPSGVNASRSTPHGTTEVRDRARPMRTSSKTSSVLVAATQSASRATRASTSIRQSGLVSSLPWCSRLVSPSAWKVCTVGIECARAARWVATPDIQKCAWATSGPSEHHCWRRNCAKPYMYCSNSSLGSTRAGPAGTCTTL